MRFSKKPSYLIGFLIPLCLFIEAGSPILLATSALAQEGAAVPLSLGLLPLILILAFKRLFRVSLNTSESIAYGLAAAFLLITLSVALAQAFDGNIVASMFFLQWNLFFLWLLYFGTLSGSQDFQKLLEGFTFGAIVNATYYLAAVVLEFVIYGALRDMGRMTQNAILPGQYQIAVYVPSMVAVASVAVSALTACERVKLKRLVLIYLNIASVIVILATGSREAILFFIFGHMMIFAIRSNIRVFVILLTFVSVLAIASVNLDGILAALGQSELRVLWKIASLAEEGSALGARDQMLAEVWLIFTDNLLLGTALIPPAAIGSLYGTTAPSAHNMYVDALLWTGVIAGGLFILLSLFLVLTALWRIIGFVVLLDRAYPLQAYFSVIVVLLFLLSNNINVPMRQPIMAPFFGLAVALLLRRT